jgi:prepilin peptidase dependent protein B
MMRHPGLQAGASIIELLVSVAIGLVIAASLFGVYVASSVNSTRILKTSKLNQELTTLMTVMVNDIRRAGYWFNTNGDRPQSNPFAVPDATLLTVIADSTSTTSEGGQGAGECILFSYDANIDDQLEAGDIDGDGDQDYEIFGFRLNNGAVEMLQMGENAAHGNDCTDATGNWLALTDRDTVAVDALEFSLADSECLNTSEPDGEDDDGDSVPDNSGEFDCFNTPPDPGDINVHTRMVRIRLDGSLVSDPASTISLDQSVRVRNEFVTVIP